MPASPTATPEHIKDVNTRYHDAAADEYDAKWGIDFGETGQEQVRLKLIKALGGRRGESFGDALEIGSGTGYFSLNLVQLGAIERLTATDIAPGMLQRLSATADALGLENVTTVATEAETLPFEDGSFDLVFGHAVLHHIPDLDKAFAEFRRVLRPGGMIAFAGEPSRYGDTLAALPKRAGLALAPVWRRAVGARERAVAEYEQSEGHSLEGEVDVHAFAPADLRRRLREAPRRWRGAALQRLGLGPADGRVERRAGVDLLRLAPLRLQQLHRPAEGRHPRARALPACLGPQAGVSRLAPQARTAVLRFAGRAGAVELGPVVEALQPAFADIGVVEPFAGGVLGRSVEDDAAGTGDAGEAAGEVDGAAVVVARLRQGRAAGDPGAQPGELLPFGLGGVDQRQCRGDHRLGLGRDQHHLVADRLHQPHRRLGDGGRHLLQPSGDHPQLLGRDFLTEPGELDQVGEADGEVDDAADLTRGEVGGADHVAADLIEQVRLQGIDD